MQNAKLNGFNINSRLLVIPKRKKDIRTPPWCEWMQFQFVYLLIFFYTIYTTSAIGASPLNALAQRGCHSFIVGHCIVTETVVGFFVVVIFFIMLMLLYVFLFFYKDVLSGPMGSEWWTVQHFSVSVWLNLFYLFHGPTRSYNLGQTAHQMDRKSHAHTAIQTYIRRKKKFPILSNQRLRSLSQLLLAVWQTWNRAV